MEALNTLSAALSNMASKKLGVTVTGMTLLHVAGAPTWQLLLLAGVHVVCQGVLDIVKIIRQEEVVSVGKDAEL